MFPNGHIDYGISDVGSANIPTAKLITGGFALRAPMSLATRVGYIPLAMSATATMWAIPSAGFYTRSPDNRNLSDSMVVIETGITEYSYFTNLSYGSPYTGYDFNVYWVSSDGDGGVWSITNSYGKLSVAQ